MNPDPVDVDGTAALERLVVENDDLLELESLIGRFNIFDALGIASAEIRHSNFLEFILDPAESHGQSDLFLKAFLMDVLKSAPTDRRPFSPITLDGIDLQGVEVKREWENIDLLITCREPAFIIAIENKVEATEHSRQLERYYRTVQRCYPDDPAMFVYLTAAAVEPSDERWVPYSYANLFRVLDRVRRTHASTIGGDFLAFLNHYLNLIGTRFMRNDQIDDLCLRIWKNHRRAFRLVYERFGSPGSGVSAAVEECVREDPRWHVFYRSGTTVDFISDEWTRWLPAIGLDRKEYPQSWFVLRFEVYEDERKLDFYVEVRRIQDLQKRKSVVDALLKQGKDFGFNRKQQNVRIKDNYTRISSRDRVFVWKGDEMPDAETIRAAVKKKLEELYPKLDRFPEFLRPLLG